MSKKIKNTNRKSEKKESKECYIVDHDYSAVLHRLQACGILDIFGNAICTEQDK